MKDSVLITGATGFLGRNLLRKFVAENQYKQYNVLVRSPEKKEALRQEFPHANINYLLGDITFPNLGLSQDEIKRIKKDVTKVWHIASSTSFNDKDREDIIKTNIDGLENTLNIVDRKGLERFIYISTAYIAGLNQGRIPENGLPSNIGFKNTYERTKYQAETIVTNAGIPFTIYRPSVLIGDSMTGFSEGECRMMYGYALGLHKSLSCLPEFGSEDKLKKHWMEGDKVQNLDFRIRGNPNVTLNLLPIDECTEMIYRTLNHNTLNQTYNIVNPTSETIGSIINAMFKAFHISQPEITPELDTYTDLNKGERRADRFMSQFHPYVTIQEPKWDMNNLRKMMKGYQNETMTVPKLDWYMKTYARKEM